jgi:hypothetical protein
MAEGTVITATAVWCRGICAQQRAILMLRAVVVPNLRAYCGAYVVLPGIRSCGGLQRISQPAAHRDQSERRRY